MTPRVEVRGVSQWFREGPGAPPMQVLRDVSLTVDAGEFAAIVGPSGCGKSTLLNVISGLQSPESGVVAIDGDTAARRLGRVAYMHQRDLLMPWRTVLENARLGLELQGISRQEADERALAVAERFGLAASANAHPWRLSGGMRQRAALLRAVLPDRGILLLDEPFGALDAITRSDLQRWLAEVLVREGRAVVLVTHDVEEALLLADRVHVMGGPPGHFTGVVEVDLPRPRPDGVVTYQRFVQLKRRLLVALEESRSVPA
jgi:ABC-type nitrate/sulfonate/bicarbonate transport system ATPase subunit